jgi:hypothetical protein
MIFHKEENGIFYSTTENNRKYVAPISRKKNLKHECSYELRILDEVKIKLLNQLFNKPNNNRNSLRARK